MRGGGGGDNVAPCQLEGILKERSRFIADWSMEIEQANENHSSKQVLHNLNDNMYVHKILGIFYLPSPLYATLPFFAPHLSMHMKTLSMTPPIIGFFPVVHFVEILAAQLFCP